jgi:hypothetical protein
MFNPSTFNTFLKHLSEISSQSKNETKKVDRMQTSEEIQDMDSRFYVDEEKMYANTPNLDKNELESNEDLDEIEVNRVHPEINEEDEEDEQDLSGSNETMSDEMNNHNFESEEWSTRQTKRRTRKLLASSNNDSSSNSTSTTTMIMSTATITTSTAINTNASTSPPFYPSSLILNSSKSSTPTSSISSISSSSSLNNHHKLMSSELKFEEFSQTRTCHKPLKHSIDAILGFSQNHTEMRENETNQTHSPRRVKKLKMFIEKHLEYSNQPYVDSQ